jgi:hypothetical protein
MEHDRPVNDWSNAEFGFRIRGLTKGADWTLSHFYTRVDSPIIDGQRGLLELGKYVLGLPSDDVFTYPHFSSTAFTFAKPWDWTKSTIRGEVVLNTNRYYQYGQFKKKKADLLTVAIAWGRNNMVPWLSYWNKSRSVSTTLTWFHYRLFGHEYNKATGEFLVWESGPGKRDSTWNKLTLSIETGFVHDTIFTVFNFSYDFNGDNVVVGAIQYRPGDHWRWMLVYQQINELGHPGKLNNQVISSIRYEF